MGSVPEVLLSEYADDVDLRVVSELFIEQCPKMLQEIDDSLMAGELDQLKFHIHGFKGAGGGAGFPLLAEKAVEIEDQIAANELEQLTDSVRELRELCDRASV